MFLSMLSEKQKQLFLGLAYNVATIDGDYSEIEEEMMNSYYREMQITLDMEKIDKTIENVVKEIKAECGERAKRIIVFEVIGLAMSDNNYEKSERELIRSAMIDFGIEEDFNEKCETALNEYIDFQNKLNSMVIG